MLEKIHPEFYPVPMTMKTVDPGRLHFAMVADGFLPRDDLIVLYDVRIMRAAPV